MTTICAKPKQTKQFVVASNALTYNPIPHSDFSARNSGFWPIITQREAPGGDVNYVCKLCVNFGPSLNFSAVPKDGERTVNGLEWAAGAPSDGHWQSGCTSTSLRCHKVYQRKPLHSGSQPTSHFWTPCALHSHCAPSTPFYTLWHIIGINMATCSSTGHAGSQGASWQLCDLFQVSDKAFN